MRTVEEIRADIASAKQPIWKRQFENELYKALTSDIPLDRLSEICTAEKDGRCKVMPCKEGTPIWWIDVSIEPNERGKWTMRKRVKSEKFDFAMLDWIDTPIYLTRAEAEKALEGKK